MTKNQKGIQRKVPPACTLNMKESGRIAIAFHMSLFPTTSGTEREGTVTEATALLLLETVGMTWIVGGH